MSLRFAIVVSRFNPDVTGGLLRGALGLLQERGSTTDAQQDVYEAPGAFELPLIAKALARQDRYAGVICLGCVIKGDTMHFEFISAAAAFGVMQAGLDAEKPVSFGILTTLTVEQAEARSRPDPQNKGVEAAAACWDTAALLKTL